jgi:AcrR family transcriptional regulator
MTSRGRPRLASPEMLTEAATELFLEKGYHHTSVDDIAHRAGVSRTTFFNYFPTKPDVLFFPIDRALERIESAVADGLEPLDAISRTAEGVSAADLPLIATQSEAMDVGPDLGRAGPARVERLRTLMASYYPHPFDNWVLSAAIASAAVSWARDHDSSESLRQAIDRAANRVRPILSTAEEGMH